MVNQKSLVFFITSCLVIYTFYHNLHDNNVYTINLDYDVKIVRRREPIYIYNGTEDFLINTTGCYIPNYTKTLVFKNSINFNMTCGERAIFIKRITNDQITFRIDTKIMKKYYSKKKITCCYKFVSRSNITGHEDTQISYTECKPFKTGEKILLKEEVFTVTCATPSNKKDAFSRSIVYEDAYVFVKKLATAKQEAKGKSWNVLIIGMDTMSRARLLSSMPSTVKYLEKHRWLDYKGYQKVGSNTFPNLMAFLTGKKLDTIYKECALGMHTCNDLIIWSKFRRSGYITAYGEDNLSLPDTFSSHKGFQTIPTHHYMRPFFLTGEKQRGNLICARHKPSAKHLLDYASEFANTYKNDKFFGTFWLNSYSHNLNNIPTLLDNDMASFFEQLNKTGVMNNTVILFLSDHGIRFGEMRVPVQSYYEERLPMFFVWIPHEFRQLNEAKYYNLQLNQNRLVTPYDLYLTLAEISNSSVESEACPQCTSLFVEKSASRTCEDAGVSEKWCSCHDMNKVDNKDSGANSSLQLAVKYIQNMADLVETNDCTACYSLRMDTLLRSHSYKGGDNKTYYVVAWQMTPGNVSFEATVVKDGNEFSILQPTGTISKYNRRGNCVINSNKRQFCVCKPAKCSNKLDI